MSRIFIARVNFSTSIAPYSVNNINTIIICSILHDLLSIHKKSMFRLDEESPDSVVRDPENNPGSYVLLQATKGRLRILIRSLTPVA